MAILNKMAFWTASIGTVGYALFHFVRPTDTLLKQDFDFSRFNPSRLKGDTTYPQYDQESRNTDPRNLTHQTMDALKNAADQNSEMNKTIEDLLKK